MVSFADRINKMDVLILCGGEGRRLGEVVKNKPKPLVEVKGIPFLDYLICYLKKSSFKRIILCMGYLAGRIREYYSKEDNIFFSEESTLLGTAGAIKNAESMIDSNPFIVVNGDTFCEVDFSGFLSFHLKKNALISISLVKKTKSKRDFGVVKIDKNNKVISFNEKITIRENGMINSGVYCFDKKVLDKIPAGEKFSLEYQLFPILKNCFGFMGEGNFVDIGTLQGLRKAENILPEMGLL